MFNILIQLNLCLLLNVITDNSIGILYINPEQLDNKLVVFDNWKWDSVDRLFTLELTSIYVPILSDPDSFGGIP